MAQRLFNIVKGARELAVESAQLPRYQADGWELVAEKKARAVEFALDANPGDLIEVWSGAELRICTVDQLGLLASLGFEPKKESDHAGQSGNHEAGRPVDEPVGNSQPRDERAGSGAEVGVAGDAEPQRPAEAGLDDEPAAGPVAPAHHFKLDRPNTDEDIIEAYAKMDPANDDHWTRYGLPRIEVLNTFLEHGPATRSQLNKAVGNPVRPSKY